MSAAKHTPGPWTVAAPSIHRVYPHVVAQNGVIVCNVKSSSNRPQARHDARLIAAAPELLEALQNLVDRSGSAGLICGPALIKDARDAIAKATGEQS